VTHLMTISMPSLTVATSSRAAARS
jgi:hypothetical protein